LADDPPNENITDPEVLRRAQAGEQQAFGQLMRAHYEPVFRLVHAIIRNEQDSRDVCQEVWLTIWKQLPSFRGDAKFSTWVHPIAVRRAIDHLRKRRRWYDRFLPFSSGDDTVASVPEPAANDDARADLEQGERSARLHQALETLPPKLRAVLALREIQGLSYDEIARTIGVPTGTVMSRLYHARRQLARKLGAQS
jgi:RNA polymerase sigma-70 factor (ECF subfamily)